MNANHPLSTRKQEIESKRREHDRVKREIIELVHGCNHEYDDGSNALRPMLKPNDAPVTKMYCNVCKLFFRLKDLNM